MYVGVCEGGGVHTRYDMVHLCQTPPPCGHLAGLLDVFKSKIVSCGLFCGCGIVGVVWWVWHAGCGMPGVVGVMGVIWWVWLL